MKNIRSMVTDLFWNASALFIKNPNLPDNPKHLLFVCKGNVCRSPFAEFFSKKISERGVIPGDISFCSSGTEVGKSALSPQEAVTAARRYDVDMTKHLSKKNTIAMMRLADMILAMDIPTFRSLNMTFPEFKAKIFLLPLFGKNNKLMKHGFSRCNIPDPYGKSPEQFESSYLMIKEAIYGLFEALGLIINSKTESQ